MGSSSRKETITDYSLKLGDLLRLRVLDHATGTLPRRSLPRRRDRAGVPLGAAGLVHGRQPRLPALGQPRAGARTSSSPGPPATRQRSPARVAAATRADGTVVKDIRAADRSRRSARSRPSTSRGISRIEEAFAIILAAGGNGLSSSPSPSPSGATSSRRWRPSARPLREVGAFLWSEAVLVLGAGLRSRRRPRMAARGDARGDAPARLRPAARTPRGPLGLPRRARRGGGPRRARRDGAGCARCGACRSARSCARSSGSHRVLIGRP